MSEAGLGQCRGCRWWEAQERAPYEAPGVCLLTVRAYHWVPATGGMAALPGIPEGAASLAWAASAEDEGLVQLWTRPDFGCSQYQVQEP